MPWSLAAAGLPGHERDRHRAGLSRPYRHAAGTRPARCQHLSANDELGAG